MVDVAVMAAMRNTLTYSIPEGMQVEPGQRVQVPLATRKATGIVLRAGSSLPPGIQARPILRVLDAEPVLTPELLELGLWIADYYIAPLGEVFRAMLPLRSATRHARLVRLSDSGRRQLREGVEPDVAPVMSPADAEVAPGFSPAPAALKGGATPEAAESDSTPPDKRTVVRKIFEPNIYLYDSYPGGVGLSEPLFRLSDSLLEKTQKLIAECPCPSGCPSCVGPVGEIGEKGKEAALDILGRMVREHP